MFAAIHNRFLRWRTRGSASHNDDGQRNQDAVQSLVHCSLQPMGDIGGGVYVMRHEIVLPMPFYSMDMDDDVLVWLQESSPFNIPEDMLEGLGFQCCVDHPGIDKTYYEGYFHALSLQREPVSSLHPRRGHIINKEAAPLRLHAFIEAMRRANAGWIQAIAKHLPNDGILRRLLEEGSVFADLAVQIHFGEGVDARHLAWHHDGPNSLLHMALSVRGNRVLHARLAQAPEEAEKHVSHVCSAGQVYLSSPYFFRHAVEYPTRRTYHDRIIAVQCRFLLQDTIMDEFFAAAHHTVDTFVSAQKIINMQLSGAASSECPLILPTMKDCLAVLQELQDGTSACGASRDNA